MITPGKLDLVVQRWTPFVYLVDFEGLDFTGATFALQVRLRPDAPGSALISLVNAAANAEGVSVSVLITNDVPTSTVQFRVNETTIEGLLLNAGRAGSDIVLAYDLHITGGGLPKTRWLEGSFTVRPGVTQ